MRNDCCYLRMLICTMKDWMTNIAISNVMLCWINVWDELKNVLVHSFPSVTINWYQWTSSAMPSVRCVCTWIYWYQWFLCGDVVMSAPAKSVGTITKSWWQTCHQADEATYAFLPLRHHRYKKTNFRYQKLTHNTIFLILLLLKLLFHWRPVSCRFFLFLYF